MWYDFIVSYVCYFLNTALFRISGKILGASHIFSKLYGNWAKSMLCFCRFGTEFFLSDKEASSMKTLLRGGYVVSGRGCRRADVLIDGENV